MPRRIDLTDWGEVEERGVPQSNKEKKEK